MISKGVEYEDEDLELHPDGSVHDATLARNTVIQGMPCAGRRSVVFFPSGRLRLAWLASPVVVGCVPCASGVVTYFHENGRVLNATLGERFQGLSAGTRATFDEDGLLLEYSERLDCDKVINGLPCSAEFHIWRYAAGMPSRVVLAAETTIGDQVYHRGAELQFDESGNVIGYTEIDLDSGHRYQQRVFGVYEAPFE
jgi:hypothetical protein